VTSRLSEGTDIARSKGGCYSGTRLRESQPPEQSPAVCTTPKVASSRLCNIVARVLQLYFDPVGKDLSDWTVTSIDF
jgi:hypothetical protein